MAKQNNSKSKGFDKRGGSKKLKDKQYKDNSKPKSGDPNDVKKPSCDGMNDIAWYAKNPQLLADTASIPFAWSTGLSLEPVRNSHLPETIPGICSLTIDLSPISIGGASDPVNVAARQITADIRTKNSGGKAYDPSDLMIHMLAEGHFIAFLVHAMRIYATASMYNPYNRYMPDSIFDAMWVDGQNIRDNMANYRAALNMVIAKAASIVYLPDDIALFHRWRWLYANYYCDSDNPKDQIYFLQPKGYMYYDIDEATSMGKLTYVNWNQYENPTGEEVPPKHTWLDIIEALNEMLNPLIEDQDLCLITGDMMKLYGNNVLPFTLVPEILIAQPVYNHDVLEQFRNATTLPETATSWTFYNSITQDEDGILLDPQKYLIYDASATIDVKGATSGNVVPVHIGSGYLSQLEAAYSSDLMLDSSNPSPTAVDVMENTRLSNRLVETFKETGFDYFKVTSGSEKVVDIIIVQRLRDENGKFYSDMHLFHSNMYILINPAIIDDENRENVLHIYNTLTGINMIGKLKMFDYCPKIYVTAVYIEGSEEKEFTYTPVGLVTRINNYALIPREMLKKMNDCALLSEMDVIG